MTKRRENRKANYSGGIEHRHDEFNKRRHDARAEEAEADRPIDPKIEIDPDARVKHVRIREPRR